MKISSFKNDFRVKFERSHDIKTQLGALCARHKDVATFRQFGKSEEGRDIFGITLGNGRKKVSLIAGAHADEPVGSQALRVFIEAVFNSRADFDALLHEFTFAIVPQINPDSEARNWAWVEKWPDCEAYLKHAFREPPGRDVEFGFPAMRPENRCVAEFLNSFAPISLHMSLHGMGFSEGAMLLIEQNWIDRTGTLREKFADFVSANNLPLHNHDRGGEKGFVHIGPGFTTTPVSTEMRRYFEKIGDAATAKLFHKSSMQYVRSLGGDPLCIVTEMPLFLIPPDENGEPGRADAYLRFLEIKNKLMLKVQKGESIHNELAEFNIRHLEVKTAVRLQLRAIELALETMNNEQ